MHVPKFDNNTLCELIKKAKEEIGQFDWNNKGSFLFYFYAKYGDSIDKEEANRMYDILKRKEKNA
jgi:hypothetical protein